MNSDPDILPAESAQVERLHDLVADALELPADERLSFLTVACGDDAALLAEACSLVGYDQQADNFLARPAYAQVADQDLEGAEAGSLAPGTPLGEYRLLALLGEGGMGEVYLAEDTKLERRVAVKLLKRRLDDASLARRFRHERKVLAALTHPNIARLYGGGTTDEGRNYLVMEYVEGEQLDRFCQTQKLGVSERLTLFRKVCAAVAYAHQNLVVHRDLKPANIRVTPEGEPKLLDFGIAKLLDPEGTVQADPTLTLPGAMTPEYASPEQLRGEAITTVSDVYSLGVVLYELLCGRRPFAHLKGRRPDELARAICEEEPPRPSTVAGRTSSASATATQLAEQAPTTTTTLARPATLRRQLEGDLDNIVVKALQKEPGRRYASVLAFSDDLRRHDEGLPVRARRDTLRYRTGKFIRRNKVGVAAGALVVLALVSGLAATAWQARVAGQERDRATQERDRAQQALASAETARKQTQGINDFLQQLLVSASPTKMGKDVKVIEVLDAAAANVDQKLAEQPEVLAAVHDTLAATYGNLGMVPVAKAQERAALAIYQRLYGPEDQRTVEAEHGLSMQEVDGGNYDEAVALLRHVISYMRQHPEGNNRRDLAKAVGSLGFCFGQIHRFPEAEQAINEAISLYAQACGENSVEYASGLGQLGTILEVEGKHDAAIELFRRSRDVLVKVNPNAIQIVIAAFNEWSSLFVVGRFAEAEALVETMRRDTRRIVGETDNFYYTLILFSSECHDFQRNDYAKVVSEGKEIVERFKAVRPPDDFYLETANYLLGASLTKLGRAGEGESYLRASLQDPEPARQGFFTADGSGEAALGNCLLVQKRYPEAEPLLLTGLIDLEKRLGPQDRLTVQARQRLHDLYLAWNKPSEAARYQSGAIMQMSSAP